MLVCVRYCWERQALEDFLFSKALPGAHNWRRTFQRARHVFVQSGLALSGHSVLAYARMVLTQWRDGILWSSRTSETSNSPCSSNPAAWFTNHREALAAKDIDENIGNVFSTCVKIVNFIKARPLNHRLFENVCQVVKVRGQGAQPLLRFELPAIVRAPDWIYKVLFYAQITPN